MAKQTMNLINPIMIDNNQVGELTYDSNEITATLFAEADARRKIAAGRKNVTIVPSAEFDYSLHLYLGFAAVIAVNPAYDFTDLERIHGRDVVEAMTIGRDFILASEKSKESSSDEQSETTHEPSTPQLPSSDAGK